MLKRHGCDVEILEQSANRIEGQAAGVATGLVVNQFLARFDRLTEKLAFPCYGARVINTMDKESNKIRLPMIGMTSWDSLYFRLRANFDGYKSTFNPNPPAEQKGDGKATYHAGKKLVSLEENKSGKAVIVRFKDVVTGEMSKTEADIVIGADGANSSVRMLCSPDAAGRKYAGYVMWRGVITEQNITSEVTKQCTDWFSFHPAPSKKEVTVLYLIPGKNGSLKAGEREVNFAWYSRCTSSELSRALTDINGHKHQWSVPSGKLDPAVWENQIRKADDSLNGLCKEVARKIDRPFLQVIGDHTAPRASFLGGKVLLVGDSLVTLRPHTGTGISSGAFHALQLEKALFERDKGKDYRKAIQQWETAVLEFSHTERLKSISWGEYYLGGWRRWLPATLHYHVILALKVWRAWAAGLI